MMRYLSAMGMAVALVAASPARAAAADKTHQQIMAEIRMLQEQQQQLQQVLGGLAETLKTLSSKIDDQAGATRKAFADSKLLVDGVADGVRILREKADDTNVRLASMTQEIDAMRQTIASMPAPAAAPPSGVDPVTGEPVPPAPMTPGGTPAQAPAPMSHQKIYDTSYADYAGGHFDLAVTGFEQYIKQFPGSPLADDAQLNIGNSYFGMTPPRYKEAILAFQRVITEYPNSDSLPAAHFKLGQSYERLGRLEEARKAYETVLQRYPDGLYDSLARQALDALKRKGN